MHTEVYTSGIPYPAIALHALRQRPYALKAELVPINQRRLKSHLAPIAIFRLKDQSQKDRRLSDESASESDEEVVEAEVPFRVARDHPT